MRAAGARFEGGHSKEALDEIGIEGGAEGDGLWEAGAVGSGVAVEAFLVEHDGDAEAAVFKEELLDGVGELGHGAGFLAASGVTGTADLAESATIAEGLLRFRQVEVALPVDELLGLLLPDAEHLRGFFFEGHAGEEIFDAAGGGERGIPVGGRRGFARGCGDCGLLFHEGHS